MLDLGAVHAAGSWAPETVLPRDFVAERRTEVGRLLRLIREVGRFSDASMAIAEELGQWNSGRAVAVEYLVLFSGCIESYPPNTDDLDVVHRMVDFGGDLQLTLFLDALVGSAANRGPDPSADAPRIADAVRIAGTLLGRDGDRAVLDTFRAWRVKFLPEVLRPDSSTAEELKARYRRYARELEALLNER